MAAYGKSSDILKIIKTRLGSEESMKGYMANELAKTGSDVGRFMAEELTKPGARTIKDMRASSDQALQQKVAQEIAKTREAESTPHDSVTFGTADRFGVKAF